MQIFIRGCQDQLETWMQSPVALRLGLWHSLATLAMILTAPAQPLTPRFLPLAIGGAFAWGVCAEGISCTVIRLTQRICARLVPPTIQAG